MRARVIVSFLSITSILVAAFAVPILPSTAAGATPRGFIDATPACSTEAPPPGAPAPTPDGDPSSIKIGGYNVLFASGTSNASLDARVPLIVNAIHGSGADVVGIAEDEQIGSRGYTSQRIARGLSAATGDTWSWCFFMANPFVPGTVDTYVGGGNPQSDVLMPLGNTLGESIWRTGIGIVSRYPIIDSGAHRLPSRVPGEATACGDSFSCTSTAKVESRAALRVVVDAPGGTINVVSTHLSNTITSLSEQSRLAQAQDLLAWIDSFSNGRARPTAVTGDFNSTPETAAHTAVVGAGFLDTFTAANPTDPGFTSPQTISAPAATVRSRIDYVFARAGVCASPLSSGNGVTTSTVIGNTPSVTGGTSLWPSDHFGVVSEIKPFPTSPATCPVTYTAHFSEAACASLAGIGQAGGTSAADVLKLGVSIFKQLAALGLATPNPAPPPPPGPCTVVVSWPASERAAIEATATAWGVTPDRLNEGGGNLVLAIIYAMAVHATR